MTEKLQKQKQNEYVKTYSERSCRGIVVLGDDFRQVLRVVRKGSRCDIIAPTIKDFRLVLFQTFKTKVQYASYHRS